MFFFQIYVAECSKSGVKNFCFQTLKYQLHSEQKIIAMAQIFDKINQNENFGEKMHISPNSRNGQIKALKKKVFR